MAGITVDTNNKRLVVVWEDDHGDVVPPPGDAFAQFTSSDVSVLRLQPEDSQWTMRIIPVAPGKAQVTLGIADGLGNPYRDRAGDPISIDPVNIEVGPGSADTATISVSDEPPASPAPAQPSAPPANAIDPNAPGAAHPLSATGPAPTPPPAQTQAGPPQPDLSPTTTPAPPSDVTGQTTGGATSGAVGDALWLSGVQLPQGTVGQDYHTNVSTPQTVGGGTAPYTFEFAGLPSGLSGDPDGSITGQPTSAGDSGVTVTVHDGAGGTASATATLTVAAAA